MKKCADDIFPNVIALNEERNYKLFFTICQSRKIFNLNMIKM